METRSPAAPVPPCPGIDRHTHLEGSLEPAWVRAEAARRGLAIPASLGAFWRGEARSFLGFIEAFLFGAALLDSRAAVRAAVEAATRRLGPSPAGLDLWVSPHLLVVGKALLSLDELWRGLEEGLAAAHRRGVSVAVVLDAVNNFGPRHGHAVLDLVERDLPDFVRGFSTGGLEQAPFRDWAPVFERARRAGLDLAAHAGENGPGSNVREAVAEAGVARIVHGVRAAEDPSLLEWLAERRIPVDVCLASNRSLVPELADAAAHPLPRMLRAGVRCALGTDDPGVIPCDLATEWAAARALGLTDAEMAELARNAVEDAWCLRAAGAGGELVTGRARSRGLLDSESRRDVASAAVRIAPQVRTDGLHAPMGELPGPDLQRLPLAIVGMGCRLPGGANDAESFWKVLADGRSGVREVPPDRWDRDRFYHADGSIAQAMISKWGGFVDGLDLFDAGFWGISPREAMRMDPQQRWLLEVAWEALEDSGSPPSTLRGSGVGVFVGIASNDFVGLQAPYHETSDAYTNSGLALSIASNRISYLLDLQGPSLSVDTACSSALVAVWTACESIWSGNALAALAGGVNAIITPHSTIGFSRASMLSPSGQCFSFDARANGYVRGEGAGMVYIKPLRQALADRDRVYAVIRSAVCNQDGHTSSMAVPGIEGQTALLRQAYRRAGIAPGRVVYMEAHGTGTPVGDPIEATALGRVLAEGRPAGQKCLVGSAKTNVGHLEGGAGIVGLLKAALVLHKRTVPPSLNHQSPNPNIPFDRLPLEIATRLQPLPEQDGLPPVVAVNSFGFGGTNAHVVLEAAPAPPEPPASPRELARRPFLLAISARDERALRGYAEAYGRLLADPAVDLADVCFGAGARKEHHDRRLAVVAPDAPGMRRRLNAWLRGAGQVRGVTAGRGARATAPLVFVFTGQGAQWWAMGRQLLNREPVFHRAVSEIDALFRELAGWSLLEHFLRPEERSEIESRTDVAQPAIFALQVALARLWGSWGIRPDAVVGHSVGELAAAWCAGVYSMEDAVRIIYHRSRLQERTRGQGRMLAVGITEAEAVQAIGADAQRVQIAGINSSNLVTLSGDTEPLEQIEARLRQTGRFTRWLRISFAFHSHQMDPLRDELLRALEDLRPRPSSLQFVSTVTGEVHRGESMGAAYWWENVRRAVRFGPAICGMLAEKEHVFLELGPHPALEGPLRECQAVHRRSAAVSHSLRREADESEEMLSGLAALHLAGVSLDWEALCQGSGRLVRLPSYPWSRERHWVETEDSVRARLAPLEHPLLGLRVPGIRPAWEVALDVRRLTWLAGHRIWDSSVFPAAGFVEIGLAVAHALFPEEPRAVEELEIRKALFLPEDRPTPLRVEFDPEEAAFTVHSRRAEGDTWDLHAAGRLVRSAPGEAPGIDAADLRQRLPKHVDHDAYYADLLARGYQFGTGFRQVAELWEGPGEVLAEVTVPEALVGPAPDFHFHPSVLDACVQAAFGARETPAGAVPEKELFLPQSIRRVRLHRPVGGRRLQVHGRLVVEEANAFVVDAGVFDEEGRRVADIRGFRAERVERPRAEAALDALLYQPVWELQRLRGPAGDRGGLPPATEMASAGRVVANEEYARQDLERYGRDFLPRLDALAVQAIEGAYADLGWRPQVGQRIRLEALCADLGIAERHRRLVRRQLQALAAEGVLREADGGSWDVLRAPRPVDLAAAIQALREDFPRQSAHFAVLEQAGAGLAAVLTGDIEPVELMFPGGSTLLLERFYAEALEQPALHAALVAIVAAAAAASATRVMRVLEVGAGTGALSRLVLAALPPDRSEFVFSDIGPAFLAAARKQFAQHPFVEYQTFDLEKDPAAQGLAPGSFDIVLATDVIHATSDVRRSLTRLRECLAPGGLLLFVEVTRPSIATEGVEFGTFEGWWRFTDHDVRPDSPVLSRGRWLTLLTDCGYVGAASFACAPDDRELEMTAFVASAPGTARAGAPPAPAVPAGARYVLLADDGGVADAFATAMERGGVLVATVRSGPDFRRLGDRQFRVPDDSEDGLRQVLLGLGWTAKEIIGLIDCRSLDRPEADGLSTEGLLAAQRRGVLAAFHLLRALAPLPPRAWFVVRDLYCVVEGDRCDGLVSSPLPGLLRVANSEMHPCRIAVVDVGRGSAEEAAARILQEVAAGSEEREVVYRGGKRYGVRLRRTPAVQLPRRSVPAVGEDGGRVPFELRMARPGVLSNLALHEAQRPSPGAGQVEVRVHAAGINFRDVMKALGTYPGSAVDALWLGDDFAGTVERVGAEVRDLRPGDEVMGIAPRAMRSHILTRPTLVWRKPARLSFAEAASLPTVFLTAHYAMVHLARMRHGERILIHGAAGGVGQAAVQIARRLGLEVFATAGTPEKRQLLAEMGVAHVMNSRTLEFADEVMEITGGRGVDAVLNSLAGDFIPKSLSVLAPFGRFLEIGKVDVYRNRRIGLQQLRDNISYFVIDLAQHFQQRPEWAASMFAEVAGHFERGEYQPPPCTIFPVTQAVEAFRHMAQGKHVGKNVLSFEGVDARVAPCADDSARFRRDGTYLVTGGAGGFCLEVARWMARHGAGGLVLMSRTGPRDEAAQRAIEQMRTDGAKVVDARGDVTRAEDVRRVLRGSLQDMPSLRGVLHGAMVLDDEFIVDLDESRLRRVFEVKAAGAWNLHRETLSLPLEHFICFSSISSVAGAPRQGAYNAGNGFLDALAHYRHARGLPALVVNWGAILGAGYIERTPKAGEFLRKVGTIPLPLSEALDLFAELSVLDPVQAFAARVDWRVVAQVNPAAASNPSLAALLQAGDDVGGGSLAARLAAASPEARPGLVEEFLAGEVAGVFDIAAEKIDRDVPLTHLGLDSLMAIELKNRIEKQVGAALPMTEIMRGPNLRQLAVVVLQAVSVPEAPTAAIPPEPAGPQAESLLGKIDDMSEGQIDELLAAVDGPERAKTPPSAADSEKPRDAR
ncbi:MAG: SDR family NAD(P)-dependent oxidoreductase [Planctomycetota bacterium]